MFEFHADRKRYFEIQIQNAEEYVIPFIRSGTAVSQGMRVLEIGAGEAGVLKAFINEGCTGVGVEFDESRVQHAKKWLAADIKEGKLSLFIKDIYDTTPEELGGKFDIIVLKDVIEHIHNQEILLSRLKNFLVPSGIIFFGFPPWQMPYGGHQQLCHKFLARVPYFHLLPMRLYKSTLKLFKESDTVIGLLAEIKETGISIERFERIVKQTGYAVVSRKHYMINPIYKWKFGLRPRTQIGLVSRIPYLRNYFTTCVYYTIGMAPA